ncbi:hypothetical protein [Actinocrispum sp. NPDC049592]|uniref:hypothetical protein n=1 Tax=Actinocrispum sp. NPDC049592 TaxID=3154835 RepID=UPI00342D1539
MRFIRALIKMFDEGGLVVSLPLAAADMPLPRAAEPDCLRVPLTVAERQAFDRLISSTQRGTQH